MDQDNVRTLIDLAQRQRLVLLRYRKGSTAHTAHERTVEPYSLTQGKQDVMVRCYQIEPEEGWRFFMLHKIESVADSGEPFQPRRPISLPTGEIAETFDLSPNWSNPRQGYRDLVSDALADGEVSRSELKAMTRFIKEHGLKEDDVRFVHASLYHRCLGAVIDDGFVEEIEVRQIRFLHRVLSRVGWCVGD